jgi:hypothetical protein
MIHGHKGAVVLGHRRECAGLCAHPKCCLSRSSAAKCRTIRMAPMRSAATCDTTRKFRIWCHMEKRAVAHMPSWFIGAEVGVPYASPCSILPTRAMLSFHYKGISSDQPGSSQSGSACLCGGGEGVEQVLRQLLHHPAVLGRACEKGAAAQQTGDVTTHRVTSRPGCTICREMSTAASSGGTLASRALICAWLVLLPTLAPSLPEAHMGETPSAMKV